MVHLLHASLLLLISSATITWPGGTYVDSTGKFQLRIPQGYRVSTGQDKHSDSYIPACSAASAVCFQYPVARYTGTNFESASVEVTVLDGKTADACVHPGRGIETIDASTNYRIDPTSPSRLIDGSKFIHNKGGGAALSHESEFDRYWGFDKGTCYELATQISTSVYVVSRDVLKAPFTNQDHAHVTAQLKAIIDSFHALKK